MPTETRPGGTMRTDYETDKASLDGFAALTADTGTLMHRLIRAGREMPYRDTDGSEGVLTPLLENHVLTVLGDISRKRLDGYGKTFAGAHGTSQQARYAGKLEKDIRNWTGRLEAYLQSSLFKGSAESPAAAVARELLDLLTDSLQATADGDSRRYYLMLRTVTRIRENIGSYLMRAEESGDTEPALALLDAHLKNYSLIAEDFNRRLATLPEFYRREVLHSAPREAAPDSTYLVITPAGKGFTLDAGTAFATDKDLTYRTLQEEYITPMQPVLAQAIRKDGSGLHLQSLDFVDTGTAETLFTGGEDLQTGWQIESPMLVLEEGRREVTVRFALKPGTSPIDDGVQQGFVLQYSTAEGWKDTGTVCGIARKELIFSFLLGKDDAAPAPCVTELHGMQTAYPALRILTSNDSYPAWAEGLGFEKISIETRVSGIRDFTFMNDLGEVDTTQPFSPFGMQAERGAWFIFGSKETALKPLKEVTLTGTWQQLPETRDTFDSIYRDYPGSDAASFRIRTEYQKDGQWHRCSEDSAPLFAFDDRGRLGQAGISLQFRHTDSLTRAEAGEDERYVYTRDKDGFFRATLDSPGIGFGMAAYRYRFTEVMMHNSRCKEKDMWSIPQEPPVPLMADVEMAYTAEQQIAFPDLAEEKTVTSPVALVNGLEVHPREGSGMLLPHRPSSHILCLAFAGAAGEDHIRLYVDMVLPKDRLPYCHPGTAQLIWQYWDGGTWTDIRPKDIVTDETAGLTQSGFVEISLGRPVPPEWLDSEGRLWLRASVSGDASACLSLRGLWTGCIRVSADGGDGMPLPAGTIQAPAEDDPRIGSVMQPLPGFGGSPAETETQSAARLSARLSNRHRAVTGKDYEQILLEHFPEIDLARCITLPKKQGVRSVPEVRLIVFSRAEDSRYFLTSPWKLKEMERTLRQYAPSGIKLQVMNPVYETVEVKCAATLHLGVKDTGKVTSNLITIAENYFMPWSKKGGFPVPGQAFSAKELCARMVNHEDLRRVTSLVIGGREYMDADGTGNGDTDTIRGSEAWSILLPDVEITLYSPDDGIGGNGIGRDFIVI